MDSLKWADSIVPDRFWSHVQRGGPDECWPWQACIANGHGHSCVQVDGRVINQRAHRISFVLAGGVLEGREVVRHSCDNRACCNPAHLLKGTQGDNIHDAIERNRLSPPPHPKGAAHPRARLTDDDVRAIRASPLSQSVLGRQYGISQPHIGKIKRGDSWGHI